MARRSDNVAELRPWWGSITAVLFESAIFAAVIVYLCGSRIRQHRENTQSWDSLLARFKLDWTVRELSDLGSPQEDRYFSPHEKWHRIREAHGLWAMFRNAGVMAAMADYAVRNGSTVDREILVNVRRDATVVRVAILKLVARYAFGAAQESICISALQVESFFMEMTLYMAEFLDRVAPALAPQFVVKG